MNVLRISVVSQNGEEVVLKVEGWVSEENVCVLEEEGERWFRQVRRLVLDLSGVRFMEDAGIELLQRWYGERLILRDLSPFLHALLEAHHLV